MVLVPVSTSLSGSSVTKVQKTFAKYYKSKYFGIAVFVNILEGVG